jgi:hypothetical protein
MENPVGVNQSDETKDELYHYCQMVKSVLDGINAVQSLLDRDRYRRVRNGFVSLHRSEVLMFRHSHGQSALDIFRAQIPDSCKLIDGVSIDPEIQVCHILSHTVQYLTHKQSESKHPALRPRRQRR